MYKLKYFNSLLGFGEISPFVKFLKTKWDEIHTEPNVFRYAINNLQERLADGKYLVQLNPNRGSNRRSPEFIDSICQPFDNTKFNFTKVSQKEIMYSIDHDGEEHTIIVNVSPISHYHSLLCPAVNKKLPQMITESSLSLAIEIMFLAQDCNLKMGANSLCGLASVNHLHYHIFIVEHTLPVELMKWKQIKGNLHFTEDYPARAFCFEVEKSSIQNQVAEIYRLIKHLLQNSIAHNMLLTMKSKNVAVYIWPRKSTVGMKQLMDFNVAVCELSGWFPVYTKEAFERLQTEDFERELKKWEVDNFETLCKQVEILY